VKVGFPYFGGIVSEHFPNNASESDVLVRTVPVQRLTLGQGRRAARSAGGHGVRPAGGQLRRRRGLPGELAAKSYDDDTPYTPAWQERITGVPRDQIITVARQFADNADKTTASRWSSSARR
jgi:nitrate reductase alpha subunit